LSLITARAQLFPSTNFVTTVAYPTALAFDGSGNLYVASWLTGTVSKVTPNGTVSTFASGFASIYGLAFDTVGILYTADAGSGIVSKITPDSAVGVGCPASCVGGARDEILAPDASTLPIQNGSWIGS
jgi:hypothetical protein